MTLGMADQFLQLSGALKLAEFVVNNATMAAETWV
jgi:hypothetical protein